MPFEIVDHGAVFMPSDFFLDPCFSAEKQVGRTKPKIMPDSYHGIDGMLPGHGRKSVFSAPLEKLLPLEAQSVDYLKVQHESLVATNQREKAQWRKDHTANMPTSWSLTDQTHSSRFSYNMDPSSFRVDRTGTGVGKIQHESSLFSCSMSETYSKKSRLPSNDALFIQHTSTTVSDYEKGRPTESVKSFDAQTIANILPDEDDLFTGLNDEVGFTKNLRVVGETLDDFDIFASGGGMELDRDIIDVGFQEPHSAGAKEDVENRTFQGYRDPNTYHSQVRVEFVRNLDAMNRSYHSLNETNYDFGSLGNRSPSHQYLYEMNKSRPCRYHPSSPVKSQHPILNNAVQAHRQPPLLVYPKTSANMKIVSKPVQHFHGSSLPANPSTWERTINYAREAQASQFRPGSLLSPGIACISPLHTLENISPDAFTHIGGGFIDMFANAGMYSPRQTSHILPGRNPVMSVPTSVGSLNGSMRFRRKDVKLNHADKKHFELDISRILQGEDCRTTLMIKNIPNKYTSRMLLASIDEHHQGSYDFIYLPIDFKNKCNVGYAFVNMIDPLQIVPFHKTFNGKRWEKFNSEKVASLAYARIQGKATLVTHFQHSSLMNEDKRCRPILFHTNGPHAGDQEPFPVSSNIRSRFGRGSSSTFDNSGEPSNETDSNSLTNTVRNQLEK